MINQIKYTRSSLLLSTFIILALNTYSANASNSLQLPYKQAGLSDQQAAAYLLDRLTYGARPGEVDRVVALGINKWTEQQLNSKLPEPLLSKKLSAFPALQMTDQQMVNHYPGGLLLSAHTRRFYDLIPPAGTPVDFEWTRKKIEKFRRDNGMEDDKNLQDQLLGQKIIRAVYSENQLSELMTDFWTNHFYASSASFRAKPWMLSYERNAIRPNVLGNFSTLLTASVKHPALLQFHENAQSALPTNQHSLMELKLNNADASSSAIKLAQQDIQKVEEEENLILDKKFRPREGVSENFSRLLVNSFTLGQTGPQTSKDITDTARAFSGWTSMPVGVTSEWFKDGFANAKNLGFVREKSFLFRADWHDAQSKNILSRHYPAGGGVEEGETVLKDLSMHPATAQNIARKIAVRFVSDNPPQSLVDKLTASFIESKGNIKQVMQTLVQSMEFWQASASREKVKSPFVLAISALRATSADVTPTSDLAIWIARMGQPLYAYQTAPTGFPEQSSYWVNPGFFTQRMNFAVNLGAGQIAGVSIPSSPNKASIDESLKFYASNMLPTRDSITTIKTLQPLIEQDDFLKASVPSNSLAMSDDKTTNTMTSDTSKSVSTNKQKLEQTSTPFHRVIGMIVGSPQFQTY